jgi:hypothetical protein
MLVQCCYALLATHRFQDNVNAVPGASLVHAQRGGADEALYDYFIQVIARLIHLKYTLHALFYQYYSLPSLASYLLLAVLLLFVKLCCRNEAQHSSMPATHAVPRSCALFALARCHYVSSDVCEAVSHKF